MGVSRYYGAPFQQAFAAYKGQLKEMWNVWSAKHTSEGNRVKDMEKWLKFLSWTAVVLPVVFGLVTLALRVISQQYEDELSEHAQKSRAKLTQLFKESLKDEEPSASRVSELGPINDSRISHVDNRDTRLASHIEAGGESARGSHPNINNTNPTTTTATTTTATTATTNVQPQASPSTGSNHSNSNTALNTTASSSSSSPSPRPSTSPANQSADSASGARDQTQRTSPFRIRKQIADMSVGIGLLLMFACAITLLLVFVTKQRDPMIDLHEHNQWEIKAPQMAWEIWGVESGWR